MTSERSEDTSPRPHIRRRLAYWAVLLVLVYGSAELLSLLAYNVVAGEHFSFDKLQAKRERVISTPDEFVERSRSFGFENQAIHPYLGFVLNPEKLSGATEHGFLKPPLSLDGESSGAETVTVAVLGGSVAMGLRLHEKAWQVLLQGLQDIPSFDGKRIIVANLAMGGMKQPQQLMVVNYFMSLGAKFDLVINLDGFNDIVLPIAENGPQGTFAFYPRAWRGRVYGLADPDLLRTAGRVSHMEELRRSSARLFSRVPLRYSIAANLFWDQTDLWREKSIRRAKVALSQRMRDRGGSSAWGNGRYAETGPQRSYATEEARYRDVAAYWKRSSIILHKLAQGSDFRYFHFLQPNQYVRGSKIFTDAERSVALPESHPYKEAATTGYPYLIEAGKQLRRAGVAFTDLTMLFADNSETLYIDACCHFNSRGYELIAKKIVRVIQARAPSGLPD